MNFKTIGIILSFLALTKTVLTSPVYSEEDTEFSEEYSITEGLEDEEIDSSYEIPDEKDINENENLCLSSECTANSNSILSKLDTNVDPCDDFYQFSCGKWLEEAVIPDNRSGISPFSKVSERDLEVLVRVLEGDYKENKNLTAEQQILDKKNFGKLKNFYNSCMNIDTINSKGIEPLIKILEKLEINKNKESYKTADGLANLIAKLSSYNIPFIVDLTVGSDFINSEKNVVRIQEPKLPFSVDDYESDDTLYFYSYMINLLLSFFNIDQNSEEKDFDKLSYSVVEFEKKLANILMPFDTLPDLDVVNVTNIKSLNEKYPYINWTTFIGNVFSAANIHDIIIDDDSGVNVMRVAYFESLNDVLKEIDVDTIAAYAEFLVLRYYFDFVDSDIKEQLYQGISQMGASFLNNERSKYCANLLGSVLVLPLGNTIGNSMNMAIGKYYIDEIYNGSPDIKHANEDMVKNIKESLKNRISQTTWLDEQTKNLAIEKIEAIIDKINYPDYIMNPEYIDEQYRDLEIVDNDFFTNIVNIAKFDKYQFLKDAYKPIDRTKWLFSPFLNNAYYNEQLNDITIPADLFIPPFFSSLDTEYLNYGGIGWLMGHEITHAIDNFGKNFDLTGGYKNWWSDSSSEEFDKLAQCFVDQYGKYSIQNPEGKIYYVDGQLTLPENLADNGGLSSTFEAYKNSLDKKDSKERNKRLPGLTHYTNEQLFFISSAQVWCYKERPGNEESQVKGGHSPNIHRVNGSVSNSKYFAEVFNCKAGSPMNPEKKCVLW